MAERLIEIRVALVRKRKTVKELWVAYSEKRPEVTYRQFIYYLNGYSGPKQPENFCEDCEMVMRGW